MIKNKNIEGLRGGCAILLVIYHMTVMYSKYYLNSQIPNVLFINQWGEIFSSVFLVISSYFLYNPSSLKFDLIGYFKKKIIRLWPMYFCCISITFIVTRFIELPGRTGNMRDYFFNATMINGYLGTLYIDGAHWYLTTLLSAIVIMGILRKLEADDIPISYAIWMFLFMVIKILSLFVSERINYILFVLGRIICAPYAGVICVGIGFHKLLNDIKNKKKLYNAFAIITFGVAVSILTLSLGRFIGIILGIVLMLICIYDSGSILGCKVFVYFGSISYPLYLIHQNIGYIIQNTFVKLYGKYIWWFSLFAIVITILFGAILGRVENILNKLMDGYATNYEVGN